MDRIKQVREHHLHGCNCAQAIVVSYCDLIPIDEQTAYTLSEGFGRGMGGKMLTCGAISGAVMILSAIISDGDVLNASSRASTYKVVHSFITEFESLYQTSKCEELLAKRAKKQLPFTTCTDTCEAVAILLEKYLKQMNS